jgi:hypothetical protein
MVEIGTLSECDGVVCCWGVRSVVEEEESHDHAAVAPSLNSWKQQAQS